MNELKFLTNLYRRFPKNSSEIWDFPGFQCGIKNPNKEIKKILLCLDYYEDVYLEVIKFKPDIIITHHPFFFGKRNEVLNSDCKKILLEKQVQELKIPLYSFHTNFDKGNEGMNDTFISYMGFKKDEIFMDNLMRSFTFNTPISMIDLIKLLCDKFNFESLDYLLNEESKNGKLLNKGAVILGGGSNEYFNALSMSSDVFISGDCPHHTRLEMRRYNINYIDLPHEAEEKMFLLGMSKAIKNIDSSIEIDAFACQKYFDNYRKD